MYTKVVLLLVNSRHFVPICIGPEGVAVEESGKEAWLRIAAKALVQAAHLGDPASAENLVRVALASAENAGFVLEFQPLEREDLLLHAASRLDAASKSNDVAERRFLIEVAVKALCNAGFPVHLSTIEPL